jgi:hypothetical protein
MSEVFEGYERQYCEVSASLFRKCTTASALDGGNRPIPSSLIPICHRDLTRRSFPLFLEYD